MKIAEEQTPSYYEIPNRRVDGFVGREDILQRLDKALSDGSVPRYAVLQGMGGQGKSQVALEYCRRKKDSPYSAIFWVDATTESSVKGSFQSISERIRAETDYLPNIDARVAFVLRMFTSWTVQWLMVFDNYDNPDTFLNIRDFIPQSEHGAILFTSRHPDSNALVIGRSNHFFELSGLEENAAVALLIQQSQTNEFIPSDARKIVERLGCHPLAIIQAGSYIRKRKLQLCEFMDHYKRAKKIILENTPQLSHYTKRLSNAEEETSLNVFTTWELSFRQLQSKLSENDVEAKLLTLLAFFDEKDISEQLFAGFSAKQKKIRESTKLLIWLNAFKNAKRKKIPESAKLLSWLDAFRSIEGQWNSDLFKNVLIRLRNSSLLQAFAQGLDGFCHVSLHPLVKDWIRLRTDRSIGQDNTYMAATLVREILLNSWQKQHFHLPLCTKQNITSHIIALEDSYQEFFIPKPSTPSKQKIFDEYIISQSWFGSFCLTTGSYHLSEIINQRVNAQNQKILGLEHPDTLNIMANIASTFMHQGRWKEAEELNVQVMETSSRVLGLEHPDTLTSMDNLASTFMHQGRWKEAEELNVQVIETRKRVLGPEHPDTLTSMNNLAFTFWSLDMKRDAIQLMSEVVKHRQEKIGSDHPNTIRSISRLLEWCCCSTE